MKYLVISGLFLTTSWLWSTQSSNIQQEVNFQSPKRDYVYFRNEESKIYLEKEYYDQSVMEAYASLQRLRDNINTGTSLFPKGSKTFFNSINYYIMYGERSEHGGRPSGARYVGINAPLFYNTYDLRWNNAVVIYSGRNYNNLSDRWALNVVLHELAHAFHIINFRHRQSDDSIKSAWTNAMSTGLYHNVRTIDGNILEEAYALKNHLEYFAELSKIYFGSTNHYFPFTKDDLKDYDPMGYNLIKNLWVID